jgi:hypothetical protein
MRGGARCEATGPYEGTFLLQCDLPRDSGTFAGERQGVGLAEAVGIFREFLTGGTHWSSSFANREQPLSSTVKLVLILAGLGVVAFLVWCLVRGTF